MQLWNTLTQTKEPFTADEKVRVYVCGITPYDTTHLGHARTYLVFDVLIRELERRGHSVRYTQNVTDVDDPLFERAQKTGKTTEEVAREWTRVFQDDMAALRIRPPDYFPRASDEIADMQRLIGDLVETGHAYRRGNRVYYRVRSFPAYGKLSKLSPDEMVAVGAERGEDPNDPLKEDARDFLLWKESQPGENSWPGPWGDGRPGWHIECSTMAMKYLGPELDIHGGGTDLIYPHHESEIAQSVAGSGHAPFARFWVHVEMVQMGGVKMSKSLGNLVLVRELRRRYHPSAIRHYVLSTHYRDILEYDEQALRRSAESVARLEEALALAGTDAGRSALGRLADRFDAALADDLETPEALSALDEAVQLALSAPSAEPNPASLAPIRDMAVRLGLAETLPARKPLPVP